MRVTENYETAVKTEGMAEKHEKEFRVTKSANEKKLSQNSNETHT